MIDATFPTISSIIPVLFGIAGIVMLATKAFFLNKETQKLERSTLRRD